LEVYELRNWDSLNKVHCSKYISKYGASGAVHKQTKCWAT